MNAERELMWMTTENDLFVHVANRNLQRLSLWHCCCCEKKEIQEKRKQRILNRKCFYRYIQFLFDPLIYIRSYKYFFLITAIEKRHLNSNLVKHHTNVMKTVQVASLNTKPNRM